MSHSDRLTDEQIAALEALEKAATPDLEVIRYEHGGGRVLGGDGRRLVADFYNEADRETWIAARNALPSLLAERRALRAEVAALRGCVEEVASYTCNRDYYLPKGQECGKCETCMARATLAALAGVRAGGKA